MSNSLQPHGLQHGVKHYCIKEIRNKAVSFGTIPKAVTVSQENSKGVRASEKRAQDLGIYLVLKPNLSYREE